MGQTTVSKSSELSPSHRLDSEFFLPERIKSVYAVKNFGSVTPLARIALWVTQGPSPEFVIQGFPCINGKNIYFGTASAGEPNYISAKTFEKLDKYKLNYEDIVITLKHATKIGRAWIIEKNYPTIFTRNVGLIRLRHDSRVKPAALLFYLWSRHAQMILDRLATGGTSGQITLAISQLKTLPVPIFTNSFQNILADFLMRYHSLIRQQQEDYSKAEQILASELGLENWKPDHSLTYESKYNALLHALRIDAEFFQPKFEQTFKKLNEGIKLIRLKELVTASKSKEVGTAAYTDKGFPFWRVSNLSKFGLDESGLNFIESSLYQQMRTAFEPKKGEVLLSKDATPGIAYYLDNQVCGIISSGILRLSIMKEIPPYYLELVINSHLIQLQIEQHSGGSVIKHLKPSDVLKILIPRLSINRENEISDLVNHSHAARRHAKDLIEKAKQAVEIAIDNGEHHAISFLKN